MARRQLELSNEVAAELAGAQDQILRTLEEHLDCAIYLRGNVVTLDGEADAVQAGATVVRELSSLVARGHEIGPATIDSIVAGPSSWPRATSEDSSRTSVAAACTASASPSSVTTLPRR